MYLLRPSLAQLWYVSSNLKAVHGFGTHAVFAAYLAATPVTHYLHDKYNTDVNVFETCSATSDVAIVSGYKFCGSKARSEWLDDRGLACSYWSLKGGDAIQVQDEPDGDGDSAGLAKSKGKCVGVLRGGGQGNTVAVNGDTIIDESGAASFEAETVPHRGDWQASEDSKGRGIELPTR